MQLYVLNVTVLAGTAAIISITICSVLVVGACIGCCIYAYQDGKRLKKERERRRQTHVRETICFDLLTVVDDDRNVGNKDNDHDDADSNNNNYDDADHDCMMLLVMIMTTTTIIVVMTIMMKTAMKTANLHETREETSKTCGNMYRRGFVSIILCLLFTGSYCGVCPNHSCRQPWL